MLTWAQTPGSPVSSWMFEPLQDVFPAGRGTSSLATLSLTPQPGGPDRTRLSAVRTGKHELRAETFKATRSWIPKGNFGNGWTFLCVLLLFITHSGATRSGPVRFGSGRSNRCKASQTHSQLLFWSAAVNVPLKWSRGLTRSARGHGFSVRARTESLHHTWRQEGERSRKTVWAEPRAAGQIWTSGTDWRGAALRHTGADRDWRGSHLSDVTGHTCPSGSAHVFKSQLHRDTRVLVTVNILY